MTFGDVRKMLWNQMDPNRPGWFRQKRRHGVLGAWRELKVMMWDQLHGGCVQREAA
jgi:hypothetical protein